MCCDLPIMKAILGDFDELVEPLSGSYPSRCLDKTSVSKLWKELKQNQRP